MSCNVSANSTIKHQACKAGGYDSFAELTAILLANFYTKQQRNFEAHRVLKAYLKHHPMTPRIQEKLKMLRV